MRIVRSAEEFLPSLESCQREAKNAFGRDRVLLERYIESPRHIEIQVFGDAQGNAIHLGERECSAQRRYQKVLEESPSPFVTAELRAAMGAAAVQAAHAIDYANAGTVEFIVAPSGEFFFMEINTRLQVEHPVTELVTGLDLVEWQLRIAGGEPLPLAQGDIIQRGHAIEVRLYAEDPDAGFLPGSGRLERLRLPAPSTHVRVDSGVVEGDTVTIFYDPMIAKLVVWDEDRPRALARMREALMRCEIEGPKSNIAFLERLVRHPAIVDASIDTGYLDRHLDAFIGGDENDADPVAAAATVALLQDEASTRAAAARSGDPSSPWAIADGWRLGHAGRRRLALRLGDARREITAHGADGEYRIESDGATVTVSGARLSAATPADPGLPARGTATPDMADAGLGARFDGRGRRYRIDADARRILLHDGERRWRYERVPAYQADHAGTEGSGDQVVAPMPGRIVLVRVADGDIVVQGQELLVMEAMKMELSLKAPRDGVIAEMRATEGEFVDADASLVVLET
jgi:3-methylcrotonyl-CoA carboxylase alpha subunit